MAVAVGASLRPEASPGAMPSLRDASNRIANVLVDDLAIVPGNRVLLRAPNTPMLAACWFAVLKAGGIAVTTVPQYRAAELRFIMAKAQVTHALCDVRLCDELEQACDGLSGVQTLYFNGEATAEGSLERRMREASTLSQTCRRLRRTSPS